MAKTLATSGDTSWFVHNRFGLFIHWGLYSLPARHEWIKQYEEIPDDVYDAKYFKHFDPDLYDPNLWAQAAFDAGMKYSVVTTKHHDGFCLWDSKLTDYKVTNTPYRQDVLAPMIEAFRAKDFRIGLYHSLIDWHHPNFPIDDLHSLRNHPQRVEFNKSRDVTKYAEYLHGQIRELLTRFGRIDLLFTDFSYPAGRYGRPEGFDGKGRDEWQSDKLYQLIRELAPQIVLNDRMDLDEAWDYKTPEQFQPRQWLEVNNEPVVWEVCQTFSGSWGYHRDETSWKSVQQLICMLIDTISKGGNLILNVGPTGRGEFDSRALDHLAGIGKWMKYHDRSIYGCTQVPDGIIAPPECRLTYNPNTARIYVHVFVWPFKNIYLDGLADKVEYAQLLNDASEIKVQLDPWIAKQTGGKLNDPKTLVLEIPLRQPDVTVPVIELFLKT